MEVDPNILIGASSIIGIASFPIAMKAYEYLANVELEQITQKPLQSIYSGFIIQAVMVLVFTFDPSQAIQIFLFSGWVVGFFQVVFCTQKMFSLLFKSHAQIKLEDRFGFIHTKKCGGSQWYIEGFDSWKEFLKENIFIDENTKNTRKNFSILKNFLLKTTVLKYNIDKYETESLVKCLLEAYVEWSVLSEKNLLHSSLYNYILRLLKEIDQDNFVREILQSLYLYQSEKPTEWTHNNLNGNKKGVKFKVRIVDLFLENDRRDLVIKFKIKKETGGNLKFIGLEEEPRVRLANKLSKDDYDK